MNIEVNGKSLSLTQSDFVAQGGQACVYKKHSTAYKIYHNPSDLIPNGKIDELSQIGIANVLAPQAIVYDRNKPIGFSMRYVSGTEFLCKLFTKSFRDKNNITPQDINALVKIMQDTLFAIHAKDVLGVDLNQMNFLTNKKFDDVYFIDVDSYQTRSYPATALMESVRDRQIKNNKWTKNSDWFSWACVVFELYVGNHPFKGRHPDFSPKDWMQMMDKNISVFNPKSKMPPATQPLTVIPKGHLKWFEAIFEKGDRCPPPQPDHIDIIIAKPKAQIISSNSSFNIELIGKYNGQIMAVRWIDGIRYVITKNTIYSNDREINLGISVENRSRLDIVPVRGDKPVIIKHNPVTNEQIIVDFAGKELDSFNASGFFVANDLLYSVVNETLLETQFLLMNKKVISSKQIIANIFHNNSVFDGLVIQNMIGTCRAAIPFEAGKCAIIHMKELDKHRIIDAKYKSRIAIIISERNGDTFRTVFVFDKSFNSYSARIEKIIDLCDANFIVKDNTVCIAENGTFLEAFANNDKIKQFNSPLNGGEELICYKNDTYVINKDELLKIQSK